LYTLENDGPGPRDLITPGHHDWFNNGDTVVPFTGNYYLFKVCRVGTQDEGPIGEVTMTLRPDKTKTSEYKNDDWLIETRWNLDKFVAFGVFSFDYVSETGGQILQNMVCKCR